MKTFEVRSAFFTRTDNDAVGGKDQNYHNQGSIFLKAAKKADALEVLKSFGYTVRPTECKIGMGNGMDALLKADVITTDTLTLTALNGRIVGKVSFNEKGERVSESIGSLEVDRTSDHYGQKFIAS